MSSDMGMLVSREIGDWNQGESEAVYPRFRPAGSPARVASVPRGLGPGVYLAEEGSEGSSGETKSAGKSGYPKEEEMGTLRWNRGRRVRGPERRAFPGRGLAVRLLVPLLLAAGCGRTGSGEQSGEPAADPEIWEGDVAAAARLLRPHGGTEEDWAILGETVTRAWTEGWDSLPMGESMARIGLTLVGTRYVPHTLELPGEEQVVVNLQELDCVTFVENVLALARFIRLARPEILESQLRTQDLYVGLLREIRYRGGRLDGYASRLHYFSDWIHDNEGRGLVRELTAELGGEVDPRAIDYMSLHPDAYRQLADPSILEAIRLREAVLSGLPRFVIPEEEIGNRAFSIQSGDILALTSTVEGLDVAHTGLAVWQGEALHLLHAPLVGDSVEVSQLPLADRILRLESQDGLRVVRALTPAGS